MDQCQNRLERLQIYLKEVNEARAKAGKSTINLDDVRDQSGVPDGEQRAADPQPRYTDKENQWADEVAAEMHHFSPVE